MKITWHSLLNYAGHPKRDSKSSRIFCFYMRNRIKLIRN